MIIELSVALIAIAFTVLVIYVVITLRSAKASLDQANETLAEVRDKVDGIHLEATKLIKNTNAITEDVGEKVKSLDTLFASIGQISESVNQVTASAKDVSSAVSRTMVSRIEETINDPKTANMMKWATLAMQVWAKWRSVKSQETDPVSTQIINKGDGQHG